MKRSILLLLLSSITLSVTAQVLPQKLTGALIHSSESWSLDSQNAFDENTSNGCVSSKGSNAWVGLDLGAKHVITAVKWYAVRGYESSTVLAVFEGANREDFMDAIPIYMNSESGDGDAQIDVTRGFRYVRYCGPANTYCRVGEVEFYGYEDEGEDLKFYQPTNLPAVVVHVKDAKEPVDKINDLPANCTVVYGKEAKSLTDSCTFRLRGNYSRTAFPKKPYRIKFANKQKMPDAPGKAKKWTLIPSHGDKTLMRNILAYDMSKRVGMPYTPYCRPVDVFVNGEYKGCYQLCDQLTVGKDRVNITELTAEDISEPNITGGYFFEVDANSGTDDLRLYSNMAGQYITIKSPDDDVIQEAQSNYLLSHFNSMMNRVGYDFTNFNSALDKETFAKFFIISEFIANTDTFWETYMYKDRGDEKFYMGPIWDCDLGFDNDNRTHDYLIDVNATGWTYQNGGSCTGYMKYFANSVLADEEYMQRIREVWAYVRASKVNEASLLSVIDQKEELLMESQKLNFKRWPVLNSKIHNNYQALGSYEAEVGTIRKFIPRRLAWFDNKLLTTIEERNIQIPESLWTTVYLPFAFSVPDDVSLYSVQSVNENGRLVLEKVKVAEPNKPYLLNGPQGDHTVEAYCVLGIDDNSNGLLTGSNKAVSASAGSYILQPVNGKVGFLRIEEASSVPVDEHQAFMSVADDEIASATEFFCLDNAVISAFDANEDGIYSIWDLVMLLNDDASEIDAYTLVQMILNNVEVTATSGLDDANR